AINTMIYIGNVEFRTAKSAGYLGNTGHKVIVPQPKEQVKALNTLAPSANRVSPTHLTPMPFTA
ncbi:hypothetical protein PXK01_03295, partial [Phaeobacter sp. PT47_59]|uniref:hypothetical protein n=1 Tax=Phaeobacter sp. PT47_59 TaxID=3029979 RepID=UPI00238047BA